MRIVFMGTPDFAVETLASLHDHGHEVIAAVTQPDKPKGRSQAVMMTPVKEKAVSYGIPVYQPKRARDPEFIEQMRELNPDAIVVVAFGQILPKAILEIPKYGCINVHASLLPKYRGAAPIQWAVIDGEKESGVTTMMMDEGLDTGDILEQAVYPLAADETGGSLFDRLSRLGGELILSTLDQAEKGTLKRTPQGESQTSYAKMLTKEMGEIDWKMDAAVIERLIRGLNPWPSAYTFINGKMLKIWSAELSEKTTGGLPGSVRAEKNALYVQTGNGSLKINELQLQGKKRMSTDAFLRGYTITDNMILGE